MSFIRSKTEISRFKNFIHKRDRGNEPHPWVIFNLIIVSSNFGYPGFILLFFFVKFYLKKLHGRGLSSLNNGG